MKLAITTFLPLFIAGLAMAQKPDAAKTAPLYLYTLAENHGPAAYDEALAIATLQGIINRDSPRLYVLSPKRKRPQFWLDLLSQDNRWLSGRDRKTLPDLDAVVQLAGPRVKGAIIWDPAVPATVNVATTVAGVLDAVVLSPEFAARFLDRWHLPIIKDLRGQFTGAQTGSKKNDAYRWAMNEYLDKGACSSHLLCLFDDAFTARANGDIGYAVTRDWAVKNKAFVFDLSPWSDEKPADDLDQKPGTDLETSKMILAQTQRLAAGKHMTELTGFANMHKYANTRRHTSRHTDVNTEWETVWQISPYNGYQNTISSECFNQSLHSQAPRHPLKQKSVAKPLPPLETKAYVCILMADYDSATPLYDFLANHWHNPDRGKIPLAWGINPDLLETYPDLIAYFYETATPADTFTADASTAGYMNPNRILKDSLPLFIRHNRQFFQEADMTMAPMVLDRDEPSPDVKDAFAQFAPDGYATIIDPMGGPGRSPQPQVWKGMPILNLINNACNTTKPDEIADLIAAIVAGQSRTIPTFYLFRLVWKNPTTVLAASNLLHDHHPDLHIEFVDPHSFFALFKEFKSKG